MQKNNKLIYFFIIAILFLALFIFATFFDLQISQIFADLQIGSYYSSNFFAVFFEIFGESVLYIMLSLAFAVMFWAVFYFVKNKTKYLLEGIAVIFVFGSYFFGGFRIFGYLSLYFQIELNTLNLIILIVFSIILSFFTVFLLKNIKKELIFNLFWFSLLVICVAILSNFLTQIIKGDVFGRMRFRAINFLNDFSFYSPWYVFNGNSLAQSLSFLDLPSDAFRSFPSGHTVACATTFCLFFLPKYFQKFNTKTGRFFCFALPIFLTSVIGVSRIVGGAHFLTDVLFGAFLVLGFVFVFQKIFYSTFKKKCHLNSGI